MSSDMAHFDVFQYYLITMKHDFSQPFAKADSAKAYILAEDSKSQRFLVLISSEKDAEHAGFYSEEYRHLPSLKLSKKVDVAQELAKLLYSYGFILQSFRILEDEVLLNYSFADKTPGSDLEVKCIHAIIEASEALQANTQTMRFMSLNELSQLPDLLVASRVVGLGIKKLQQERI